MRLTLRRIFNGRKDLNYSKTVKMKNSASMGKIRSSLRFGKREDRHMLANRNFSIMKWLNIDYRN